MVDWCAVYQGTLDMGDYSFDHPVFQILRVSLEPNPNRAGYTDVTGVVALYPSRRVFNSGKAAAASRYVKSVVAPADMPNSALKAGWMVIATEYTLDPASLNYFPFPAVPLPPMAV